MKKESLKELQERYELVLELKYMLEQNMNRNWGYDLTEEKKRLIRLNKEIEDIKDLASTLLTHSSPTPHPLLTHSSLRRKEGESVDYICSQCQELRDAIANHN